MTTGIHHITAIASNGQNNLDFYTKVLGLRLVKKTVNQDDVETYHLFYGDRLGEPGMDLTFFIFQPATQGRPGAGQVTATALTVPESSLPFWKQRLDSHGIKSEQITTRFGKKRLTFYDPDHQKLEFVGDEAQSDEIWTAQVGKEHAIRSFYSAELTVRRKETIDVILSHVFGYELVDAEGQRSLYAVPQSQRAQYLEVLEDKEADAGLNAAGTIHHIAFRAKNEEEQTSMRAKVLELGLYPTTVIDRFYFKSVYFRTPAGILFEIATDGPGFVADESEKTLGEKLALPPFLENRRAEIESNLPTLHQ